MTAYCAVSSMTYKASLNILSGRPFGGVAISGERTYLIVLLVIVKMKTQADSSLLLLITISVKVQSFPVRIFLSL